jgi:hypothetical protein
MAECEDRSNKQKKQEMYRISVKLRKFHFGRPWHRILLKCAIQSYQFSRYLIRGIYTEDICLVLYIDDGFVDTSPPNFVSSMIPLVFANQPKALVCNEGCRVMITTKTTGNKPVEAWMGHRELPCKGYSNRSRQMWRESVRGTSVRKFNIVNTRSVIFRLISTHLCNTYCPLYLWCSGWCWAHNCVTWWQSEGKNPGPQSHSDNELQNYSPPEYHIPCEQALRQIWNTQKLLSLDYDKVTLNLQEVNNFCIFNISMFVIFPCSRLK